MNRLRSFSDSYLVVASLLWIGLLIGVSFLATPAKFLAPSLTLPVALDVGRQTFAIFSGVEVAMTVVLFIVVSMNWVRSRGILAVLIGGCVALQALWLLPALDARVDTILQGELPPGAALHEFYIGIDLAKLALLGTLTWSGLTAQHRLKEELADGSS